ncbi:hypothetical protein HY251_13550 [bacterium]|nr:hypothetical protein [bacterium]
MGRHGAEPERRGRPDPADPSAGALPRASGPVFLGRFLHALDDKRRVAIPKGFREEIEAAREGADLFLVRGFDRCLWLFTGSGFRSFAADFGTLNDAGKQGHEQLRQLRRDVFSWSTKLTPDKQGRVVLPLELCERVGIGREVLFCGVDDRIEVWSPEAEEAKDDPERHRKNSRELLG